MASSTSNSSGSFRSARTSPSQGIWDLILYADRLEELSDTMSSIFEMSINGSLNGDDEGSVASQHTIDAGEFEHYVNQHVEESVLGGNNPGGNGGNTGGGLQPDNEGKETRQAMLERRRKECKVEEVDVALAPVMKIPVSYVFYPEQYKRFRQMFPRINVDSGLSYTHHDHPVAHTATLVGIRKMQSMLASGARVLDLHGNPNGNERYNDFQRARLRKRPTLPKPPLIQTLVEHRSAADAVRKHTKWGPQWRGDEARWIESPISDIPKGCYDVFLSCHTLYYYSMYEVCKLLNKNPNSQLMALVNYSPEQSGTLYGELKFSKQGGMTVQHSPNGERYSHPDIDQWFQTNTFRGLTENVDSGISWTSINIGGPLYILTIVKCDWGLARNTRYDPPQAPTLQVSENKDIFFGLLRLNGADVRLRITNVGLASELRHFMVFRDRSNPQTFSDLCVKARRCTSVDIVDGSRQFAVNDGDLQDHIVYAYLVDAPGELELMDGIKILRGDLLNPLGESLKLQGDTVRIGLFEAMFSGIRGRTTPRASLKSRSKPKGMAIWERNVNTGGLLPTKRT